MLDRYKRRVMPPIHTADHERPVDNRSAKKAYDELVARGYPKQDANDYIRSLRAKYNIEDIRTALVPPAPPMPEVPSELVPPAPMMPPVPEEFAGDFVARRRPPAAPPMPSLPPGY